MNVRAGVAALLIVAAGAQPAGAERAVIACNYAGRIHYGPGVVSGFQIGSVSTDDGTTLKVETIPLTGCAGARADGVLADGDRKGTLFIEGGFVPPGIITNIGVAEDTCVDELSAGEFSVVVPLEGGGTYRAKGSYVWERRDGTMGLFLTDDRNGRSLVGAGTWTPIAASCDHPFGVFLARIEGALSFVPTAE